MTEAKTTSQPIEQNKNGISPPSDTGTTVTVQNVVSAREALVGICSMKLKDFDLMLKIRRSRRELEPLFEDYEEERRKLIDEHAKKDEDGELITTDQGAVDFKNPVAFNRELTRLQKTEVQVDTTFVLEDFRGLVEELGMPGEYLVALGDLVD